MEKNIKIRRILQWDWKAWTSDFYRLATLRHFRDRYEKWNQISDEAKDSTILYRLQSKVPPKEP
jgi:hypothetical protein